MLADWVVPTAHSQEAKHALLHPSCGCILRFRQVLGSCGSYRRVACSCAPFSAGTNYVLSFYIGSRYWQSQFVDGNQTVTVTIDGNLIGTWAETSFSPFSLEAVEFSVPTNGTHTLAFNGIIPGDHTAFVSGVSIASVPEPTTLLLVASGVGILGRRFRRG